MSADAPATPPPSPPAPPAARSRRRLWLVVGAAAVIALAAAGFVFGQPHKASNGGNGRVAPDFSLPDLRGDGQVGLATYSGKPIIVNFFASWCVPCRKEMAAFQSVSSRLGDRVAFLGVDHQDNRSGGQQLLADTGVRYPTGYDPDGKVAARYSLFGMPTTVFIAPDGRVLEKHTGELSESALAEMIEKLFGISS